MRRSRQNEMGPCGPCCTRSNALQGIKIKPERGGPDEARSRFRKGCVGCLLRRGGRAMPGNCDYSQHGEWWSVLKNPHLSQVAASPHAHKSACRKPEGSRTRDQGPRWGRALFARGPRPPGGLSPRKESRGPLTLQGVAGLTRNPGSGQGVASQA